jgi:hypothetical protein
MRKLYALWAMLLLCCGSVSADVTLNGMTYDDEAVSQLITVITATSPIPSHPNTKLLERAQRSLFVNPALARCKKIIVFDGIHPNDRNNADLVSRYEEYKRRCIELTINDPQFQNTTLLFCPEWGHLCGAVSYAISAVETPYVFMHQHDLVLLRDFDLNGLIATMTINPNIKHVHLRPAASHGWLSWFKYIDNVVDGPSFVPLLRCGAWTDQCHVASVQYYNDFVLPQCHNTFMEAVLCRKEQLAVEELGIDEGHKPYGTYVYGTLQDAP